MLFNELKRHDNNFIDDKKIYFSDHHLSHAASAFFPSPFEEAIVLTADGVGEWATTTVAIGNGNNLVIKKEIHFPHSLGLIYSAFTYYTGFKVNSGEYKLMGLAPYGDYPTFSLSVNHYQTYTGITDKDRALTIMEMANIYNIENKKKKFVSSFKTPGHVPLLIASKGLLASRQGHTEMSVYLTQIAGLTPVTAICEMMDAETYSALSVDKAEKFGKQNGIPLIDGKELLEYAKVN